MIRRGSRLAVWLAAGVFSVATVAADGSRPLPDPLTLGAALAQADAGHPDLRLAQSQVELAQAGKLDAESLDGLRAGIEARATWVDPPSSAPDQSHDDSRASLYLSKPLYDFGRSSNRIDASEADIRGRHLDYQDVRNRHRILIMSRFFDVLLADLEQSRDNQAMAVAYVRFDKARDRNKVGDLSDIELARLNSVYQAVRAKEHASEARQRATRALLAEALNRPGQLPDNLVRPDLNKDIERKLPDVDRLTRDALLADPALAGLRERLEGARKAVAAARAGSYPTLSAEASANAYRRKFGSRDPWVAGLVLNVPLSTGGSVDAAVAKRQAEMHGLEAKYASAEAQVRQRVLTLWQRLQVLKAQKASVDAAADYRDLYLDRSRALYDLEVTTDLGDAMVEYSDVRLRRARNEFELALAWARLDAVLGREPMAAVTDAAPATAAGKP